MLRSIQVPSQLARGMEQTESSEGGWPGSEMTETVVTTVSTLKGSPNVKTA